jgi:5-methylcytosine-specific restriction endonuclease McrA
MKKPKALHNFYKSDSWKIAREIKFMQTNGRCERCGGIGQEVHHKIRLKVENINDVSVTIYPENLELLCKDCHNKEHKRFILRDLFDENGDLVKKT